MQMVLIEYTYYTAVLVFCTGYVSGVMFFLIDTVLLLIPINSKYLIIRL